MTTQEESHNLVREAITDSYDAVHLMDQGKLTAEQWELAARAHLERIVANASMETHSAWHDGDAVSFAADDFQLAQLAHQQGGTTELYELLRRPLTRDQMLKAINWNEGDDVSTTAANRERSAALREFQAARDAAYVEQGLLTQEAADEREFARVAAERRESGLDVVPTPDPEELEGAQEDDEPQYDYPARTPEEAAARNDMARYIELTSGADHPTVRTHAARRRHYAAAGYNSDGTRR
jgi:hypothetical protein